MDTQEQIQQLKDELEQLKSMLTFGTMPFELKEIIRGEVIKSEDSLTSPTQQLILTGEGEVITIGKLPTGVLVFQFKGKEYKIPFL